MSDTASFYQIINGQVMARARALSSFDSVRAASNFSLSALCDVTHAELGACVEADHALPSRTDFAPVISFG